MGYDANAVQQQGDLTEALEHLANTALSDKTALTNLTQVNLTLAKQLGKAHKDLDNLKKKGTKKEANKIDHFTPGMHTIYYC
eukprot:15336327-Ditylum_brightwellii.AAC.1